MRLRLTVPAIAVASAVVVLSGLLATTFLVQSQTGIDEETHLEPSVGPVEANPPTMAPKDLPPGAPESKWPQIRTENDSPDFEGELLGIYLGNPATMEHKERIPNLKDWCPGGFETVAAHPFAPPVPPFLPPGAEEQATVRTMGGAGPGAGATVCKDTGVPYTGWRMFAMSLAGDLNNPDFRPTISLQSVQQSQRYRALDASAGRIQVIGLGGRQVIAVTPVVPDVGVDSNVGEVIVPTTYGYLAIVSVGIDFGEVLKVAESLIPLLQPPATTPAPEAVPSQ